MIGQIVIWQVKEQKPFGYIVTNGKESALLHESQCEGELQVGDEDDWDDEDIFEVCEDCDEE